MTEIAVAFDVESLDRALALDAVLGEGTELAKLGLRLFTGAGPEVVRALTARGRRVFLDLKLHDIPNTVRGAAAEAARLGAELITVHALGGPEMIRAAVDGAGSVGKKTGVLAVTLLTSLEADHLPPGFQRPFMLHRTLADMLVMSETVGARGIVCSAADLPGIREHHPGPFFAVTPGIRPLGLPAHDQRRVTTVSEAVRLGSSLIVVGRAITDAQDPHAALEQVRAECEAAASIG